MRGFLAAGLAIACAAYSSNTGATTYDYVQGGYPGGALVTGSFEGSDLNNDGVISSFDGELMSLTFNFSGNGDVPAFSLDQTDFNTVPPYQPGGLVYNLDGTIDYSTDYLQVGNGFNSPYVALGGADNDEDFCLSHPGCGFVAGDESGDVIRVSVEAVPEPASWAMMILGFGLAGGIARTARRQRASGGGWTKRIGGA